MRGIAAAKNDKQAYYVLSNSDRPGDQLVTHLLEGMNYPTWRRAVTNALVSKHKIVFVDGRLPKPAEGDPDEENWITNNSMVMSWILNSLNEELHDSIVYHDTARGMLLELKERFSQGSGPRIQEIKQEIVNTRQGDIAISTYYAKMKSLWDQLSTFAKPHDPKCPGCTCVVATKEEEEERLHQFLMGLNEAFGVVRSNILCKEPLPTLSNAYSGASDHIVSDATLLKATSILTRLIKVTLPNGEKAETIIQTNARFKLFCSLPTKQLSDSGPCKEDGDGIGSA
ncbi:Retrotransposon Copia-like, N-terminal [Dillenia turbinata]|uniref:Retrotransposon Copia-like, N-terminal n=1 Tax=Dillenia turbinata TaxID=194707 RepID=A0AAN8V7R2_9MAGN